MTDLALSYLNRRFDLYEHLFRSRLLDDTSSPHDEAAIAADIGELEEAATKDGWELPVQYLRNRTGISGVAEDVLLLSVAFQLDNRFGRMTSQYFGSPAHGFFSPSLCQSLLTDSRAARLALARVLGPASNLMGSNLLTRSPSSVAQGEGLGCELIPTPFLSWFLLGQVANPFAFGDAVELVQPAVTLDQVTVQTDLLDRLQRVVKSGPSSRDYQLGEGGPGGFDAPPSLNVLLTGEEGVGRRILATALAEASGARLVRVHCGRVALLSTYDAAKLFDLVFSFAWFFNAWLLFEDCDALMKSEGRNESFSALLAGKLSNVAVTCFVTAIAPDRVEQNVRELLSVCVQIPPPERSMLRNIFRSHLPHSSDGADVEKLIDQRVLSGVAIRNATALSRRLTAVKGESPGQVLDWAIAGMEAANLGTLATRTYQKRCLADLILPEKIRSQIQRLVETASVRQRVHREWGFSRVSSRGLGLSCLFHGDSGTGKTLAAEVIASEVGLPLYRVNMAEVVSKYIGETSKNLTQVFSEAAKSRCVLLFDEADSIFSKRTEVKKSTDRYSNMEINLLLQLMEGYDGITVCTTNLRRGIDQAFERRFSFVIHFPMPDEGLRLALWRLHLPSEAPLGADLDEALPLLAQDFELSGGSIRAVVLRGAYRAAIDGDIINEHHLRKSARDEYRALGKLVRERDEDEEEG